MTIIIKTPLDSIDSVPIHLDNLSPEMTQWLTALVDNLNYTISILQTAINQNVAPSYTTAQITALSPSWTNGTIVTDSTSNQLKAKVNGVIVVLA